MIPLSVVVDTSQYYDRTELKTRTLSNMIRRCDYQDVGTAGFKKHDFEKRLRDALAHPQWEEVLLMIIPPSYSMASYNVMKQVRTLYMNVVPVPVMRYATIADGGTQANHPPRHTHTHTHTHMPSHSHTYIHRLPLH